MVLFQFNDAHHHVLRLYDLFLSRAFETHLERVVAGSFDYTCHWHHHVRTRVDEDVSSDEYVLYRLRRRSLSVARAGGGPALCIVAGHRLLLATRWRVLVRILVTRGGDQCQPRALEQFRRLC
jgi:hypothetical protein